MDTQTDLNRQIAEELGFYRTSFSATDTKEVYAGITGADVHYGTLPDWEHSVDAALTLPIPDEWCWNLHYRPSPKIDKVGTISAFLLDPVGVARNWGMSPELPEAMCEAWLAYRKAQK